LYVPSSPFPVSLFIIVCFPTSFGSRNSRVGMTTRCSFDGPGSNSKGGEGGKGCSVFQNRPGRLWGPLSLLFSGYWDHSLGGCRSVLSTSHFLVVSRLRMSGAIPPLPLNAFVARTWRALPFYEIYVFRRFRKIAKSESLSSSCLSVRPHGTTRLPLDGFLWNLIFEYSKFIKTGKE
jgi:hypothetical protein